MRHWGTEALRHWGSAQLIRSPLPQRQAGGTTGSSTPRPSKVGLSKRRPPQPSLPHCRNAREPTFIPEARLLEIETETARDTRPWARPSTQRFFARA